jgi:MFS family permease
MVSLTTSATLVALIQTAAGLPVVLLAVPAGAIGDLADRRRLLIASQSFMLLAARCPYRSSSARHRRSRTDL